MVKSAGGQSRSSMAGRYVTAKSAARSSRMVERVMQSARVQFRPGPRPASSQIQPPSASSAAREQAERIGRHAAGKQAMSASCTAPVSQIQPPRQPKA